MRHLPDSVGLPAGFVAGSSESTTNLVRRLTDLGLLDMNSVVDGDLELREIPRRNQGLLVLRRHGPSYFLKSGTDRDGVATVARERARYRELHATAGELRRFLLILHDDVPVDGLVMEGLPDAVDLHEHHRRTGQFPAALGGEVGRSLGLLHLHGPVAAPGDRPASPPWVLAIHRPSLDEAGELSPAAVELLQAIQRETALTSALEELSSGWGSDSLVHGDVRWANVLVEDPQADVPRIRLIDWELAAEGDPAWDVGCALASYLSCWVFSTPSTDGVEPWDLVGLAESPLEDMTASVAAFWRWYCDTRDANGASLPVRLGDAMRYCAARLLQTAFESSADAETLDRHPLLHVRLASNIMARPEASASDLFGLTPFAGAYR